MDDELFECKCPKCGCEFRFSPENIIEFSYVECAPVLKDDSINCPDCKTDVRDIVNAFFIDLRERSRKKERQIACGGIIWQL